MKAETELGKIAKDYIEKGQLVPDELIVDMLANVLDSKKPAKGVIFDGFPRTIPQAKALKKMLNERGTDVSVMLNLQVEEEELIKRYWSAVKYPDVLTITWRRSNPTGCLPYSNSSFGRLLCR